MTRRRGWQYLFIAWFTVASVFVPYRQAKAVLPLVPVALALVDAAGAVLASDALLAAGTSLLGAMAVVAVLGMPGDTSIRIPLTDDQTATDAAMPAPAAPGSAAVSTSTCGRWYGLTPSYHALPEVCGISSYEQACSGTVYNGKCFVGQTTYDYFSSSTKSTCPAGYTASGTSCVLSSARLAVSDNKYDVARSGGQLSAPTSEADSSPGNFQISNGSGVIWGTDANGRPFVTTITPSGTGSTISTQSQSGGVIQTNSITLAGDGSITQAQSGTASGSISLPTTAGAVPTVTTGAATTPIDITFPTDYARQGEASTAANTINTRLDKIHDDLSKTATAPEDLVAPDASEFTSGFFDETFDSLRAWRLPGHSGQCPTADLSFTFWGHFFDLNLTAHCQILESDSVRSVAEVSLQVVWLLAALFIVLGA